MDFFLQKNEIFMDSLNMKTIQCSQMYLWDPEVCKLHACVTGCEMQVLMFPRHSYWQCQFDTHIKCGFNKDIDFYIRCSLKCSDLAAVIKMFHFVHWAILYHASLKFKLNFFCRMLSSGFFHRKKEKRFICIKRQLILSYGSERNISCLEEDIISILQVCFWSVSAWSYKSFWSSISP